MLRIGLGLAVALLGLSRMALADTISSSDEERFQAFGNRASTIGIDVSTQLFNNRGNNLGACYIDLAGILIIVNGSVEFIESLVHIHNSLVNELDKNIVSKNLAIHLPKIHDRLNDDVDWAKKLLTVCGSDTRFTSDDKAVSALLDEAIEAVISLEQRNPKPAGDK